MPRDRLIALQAEDISAFAKSLRQQLSAHQEANAALPGHLSLLNMLARAAGHRNIQALKASQPDASQAPSAPRAAAKPLPPARGPRHPDLSELADRALRQFDPQGRLMRWPSRHQVQRYALWGLWLHFDSRRHYTEPEVNEVLKRQHCFGDHCTLRRELVNMKLLARSDGGRDYRKLAARPEADLLPLLRELRERAALGATAD